MSAIFCALMCFLSGSKAQTFSKRFEFGPNSVPTNVWETVNGYMSVGVIIDTTGKDGGYHFDMFIAGFGAEGDTNFVKYYGQPTDEFFPGNDANWQLNDTLFLFAATRKTNSYLKSALVWINLEGDTLETKDFDPPWPVSSPGDVNNWAIPEYISLDAQGNIYMAVHTVNYGSWNNFSIYKISPAGELF
ncbi:MAG: hypothetical protein SH856_10210 [Flavobacteriales bacterium]|nr:hypothetical protein [Flavobacteriales bacterium]